MEVLSLNPYVIMVYTQRFLIDWFLYALEMWFSVQHDSKISISQFRERKHMKKLIEREST